jgi:hypothetical protein
MSEFHPFSVWQQLRKNNPHLYHTIKTQRLMRWSYQHLGEAFFDLHSHEDDQNGS